MNKLKLLHMTFPPLGIVLVLKDTQSLEIYFEVGTHPPK